MALPVTFVAGNVLTAQQLNDSFNFVYPGYQFVYTASFTTVSSVSMPTATFTSDYDEYQIVLTITDASANSVFGIRVNNAGSPRTGSNYSYQTIYRQSNGFASGTNAATATSFAYSGINGTNDFYRTSFIVSEPTSASIKTRCHGTYVGANFDDQSLNISGVWGGAYETAEANDGLTFFPASGTISGKYYVYGLVNA